MQEISSINYNELSPTEIINSWKYLDKEALLKSGTFLTAEILDKLFDNDSVDNSVIWSYREFSEKEIKKYAKTPSDWMFVCARFKMSPEFMTEYRNCLHLTYIDYTKYTVAELLRTKLILFPVRYIRHYPIEDKLRLLRAQKISRHINGSISSKDSDYMAAWDPMVLVGKKAPFKEQKPFIIESGLQHYNGACELTYDNILELFEAAP